VSLPCLRCPKCGNRDALELIEFYEECGVTHPGRIMLDGDRALVPPGDFFFEPGLPLRVEVRCAGCGHQWRPRRQSVTAYADRER